MKKILSLLMVLCLIMGAASALAAGNKTIAVRGQNDFDDYISSMFVWGDKLLLNSYNTAYAWNKETGELTEVKGFEELREKVGGYNLEEGEEPLVEHEEDEYCNLQETIYTVDDKLYMMADIGGNENNGIRNVLLELTIGEDGTFALGEQIDLGDALAVEEDMDGESYVYSRYLEKTVGYDGVLYGLSYGDNGMELLAIDIASGDVNEMNIDVDGEIVNMARYKEGQILLTTMDYNSDPVVANLVAYDLATEEATTLGELPRDGWETPSGICYDAERSKVYYILAGSAWRMDITDDGFGTPEEFSDMPIGGNSSAQAVLMDELYIIMSYDGVIGRDVTQEKLPEQHLRVANIAYDDAVKMAYFPFTDAHPEYMVSISNTMDIDALMSNMMNRSSDIDIYTIDGTDEAFYAMMSRGFMAELSGSEKLKAATDSFYPFIKDTVTKDGEVYALPLGGMGGMLSVNMKVLEKMGFTKENLPTTWIGLYELLQELPAKLEEFPEVSLCDTYMTEEDVRREFFYDMLEDYFTWLDADESHMAEGSQVLVELCEAFEKVDWKSLGLKESDEEDDQGAWAIMTPGGKEPSVIFEFYETVGFYRGREDMEWLPLSVKEGEKPVIGMNMTFAFVNPFSEHREAAIEYLEYAWNGVNDETKMRMIPSINDPVENEYYEENLKSMQKNTDDIKKQIEKTEDEEKKEELSTMLKEQEEWTEEYKENNRYSISPESIERYRSVDDLFTIQKSAWWNAGEEVQQYMDGAMSAQQLASSLEKTMQMKRLEGN